MLNPCLDLAEGDRFLVVYDEEGREVRDLLRAAADDAGVVFDDFFAAVESQREFRRDDSLPLELETKIGAARAIATCIVDEHDCLPFRAAVVDAVVAPNRRLGHMPGLRAAHLAWVDLDYELFFERCDLLLRPLIWGNELTVVTRDPRGKEHRLLMGIGGWSRKPVASTAIIADGTWGNIPAGEVVIAPVEGTAFGEIVLDGTLHTEVLDPTDPVVLRFREGKLDKYATVSERPVPFLDLQERQARENGDPNWRNLAELGIGLNPNIREVTGSPLIDEKVYGIAHIALGLNAPFGGTVRSDVHLDMVFRRPCIEVDGRDLVWDGEIVARAEDWEEDHRRLEVGSPWDGPAEMTLRVAGLARGAAGEPLEREWFMGNGRAAWLRVGQEESARAASRVHAPLREFGEVSLGELREKSGFSEDEFRRLLQLLADYRLVAAGTARPACDTG